MTSGLRTLRFKHMRDRALRRVSDGPLRVYLEQDTVDLSRPCTELEYLALDFETTGLDPRRDEIISMGCVPFSADEIALKDVEYRIVRPSRPISRSSAVIHGVLDDQAEAGIAPVDALELILGFATNRVLVAHHAGIERQFLRQMFKHHYGYGYSLPCIDTMALERRRLGRMGRELKEGELRLHDTRRRYGLPEYGAHNALIDAIAAAELCMAQIAVATGRGAGGGRPAPTAATLIA